MTRTKRRMPAGSAWAAPSVTGGAPRKALGRRPKSRRVPVGGRLRPPKREAGMRRTCRLEEEGSAGRGTNSPQTTCWATPDAARTGKPLSGSRPDVSCGRPSNGRLVCRPA